MDNYGLKILQRRNTLKHNLQAMNTLNDLIDNWGIDLIFGIPNESYKEFFSGIKQIQQYNIKHISLYEFSLDEEALWSKKQFHYNDEETINIYNDFIAMFNDFEHYEISNFAKPYYYSKHNIKYWQFDNYIGLGVSAHSFVNGMRFFNGKNLKAYYQNIRSNHLFPYKIPTTKEQLKIEYIITSLRTKWGLNLQFYKQLFGTNFLLEYKNIIEKNKNAFLIKDNYVILKPSHYLVSDKIFMDFL